MKRFVVGMCIAIVVGIIWLEELHMHMMRGTINDQARLITDLSNGKSERGVTSNVICTSGTKWPAVAQLTEICK